MTRVTIAHVVGGGGVAADVDLLAHDLGEAAEDRHDQIVETGGSSRSLGSVHAEPQASVRRDGG